MMERFFFLKDYLSIENPSHWNGISVPVSQDIMACKTCIVIS